MAATYQGQWIGSVHPPIAAVVKKPPAYRTRRKGQRQRDPHDYPDGGGTAQQPQQPSAHDHRQCKGRAVGYHERDAEECPPRIENAGTGGAQFAVREQDGEDPRTTADKITRRQRLAHRCPDSC